MVNWRKLAIRIIYCPVCASRRLAIRLDTNEISVRCLTCRASAVTISLVAVLRRVAPNLETKQVYELSSRGALFNYLVRNSGKLTYSEYFDNVAPGEFWNGIQCQDVQNLTYPDESFDVCTSTEVFEHVPDDLKGFSEIRRVLKPDGIFVFTVPLLNENETVERARLTPTGEIQYLLSPEYHGDPIRGHKPVLAFRNYGQDIVDRLHSQGFINAEIVLQGEEIPWGYVRPVVIAYRGTASSNGIKSDAEQCGGFRRSVSRETYIR